MNEAKLEDDITARTARRLRVSDLLQRPFDIRSIALTGLFILALFYTIYFMRSVLLPIVLALLLSYLLTPVVRALGRLRIIAPIAAAVVLLTLVGSIGIGISFLATPAADWLQKAPYSLQQLQRKLLPLRKPMERVAQASGEIEKMASSAEPQTTNTTVEVKRHTLTDMLYLHAPEWVMSTVLLLILLYFLLAYDGVFLTKMTKLTPRLADKKRAVSIAHQIEAHVSRYLLTITFINVCLGLAVGTTVGFLGLPNPIMWGVLVAVLNFVPYLGALTGIVCMTLGSLLSYDSLGYALIFPAARISHWRQSRGTSSRPS